SGLLAQGALAWEEPRQRAAVTAPAPRWAPAAARAPRDARGVSTTRGRRPLQPRRASRRRNARGGSFSEALQGLGSDRASGAPFLLRRGTRPPASPPLLTNRLRAHSSPPWSRSPNSFIFVWWDLRLICRSPAARVTFPPVSSSALAIKSFSSSADFMLTMSLSPVSAGAPSVGAAIAPGVGAAAWAAPWRMWSGRS